MLVQRCGSCNYGGPALFQVYNASALWQHGDWWFMAAENVDANDVTAPTGWAAMRAAWGGTNFTNATSARAALISGEISLFDTWSPLLLIAADASAYANVDEFVQQVVGSKLDVDAAHTHVEFSWHGRKLGFTPGPGTWHGHWTLPTLEGRSVDVDPDFVYSSPHLNAALDSEVVTTRYGNYSLIYNFTDDTITRGGTWDE